MKIKEGVFNYGSKFNLESGKYLPDFKLAYSTLGTLNSNHSNVVWVCHALTGSSNLTDWWKGFFYVGGNYDPSKHFIICANVLGGCYGSTGPLSVNPETGQKFFHDFPSITNRDIVRAFDLLRQSLGIESIHTLIGNSLGGQHAVEWAIMTPNAIKHLVLVATNAQHSPWGIAFNEAQRMAIAADSTWIQNSESAGLNGMKAARAMGMISYRSYDGFKKSQSENSMDKTTDYRAASYQQYQGRKLTLNFNAFTYWILSQAMDSHQVGRGRDSVEAALQRITAETLVIGINSDLLFPVSEQLFLATNIPKCEFMEMESIYGHDGFLIEIDKLNNLLTEYYSKKYSQVVG